MAQFVLVNVVVAVLMKHLEESHKHMDDDIEIDAEIERQLQAELEESVRRKVMYTEQESEPMGFRAYKITKSSGILKGCENESLRLK